MLTSLGPIPGSAQLRDDRERAPPAGPAGRDAARRRRGAAAFCGRSPSASLPAGGRHRRRRRRSLAAAAPSALPRPALRARRGHCRCIGPIPLVRRIAAGRLPPRVGALGRDATGSASSTGSTTSASRRSRPPAMIPAPRPPVRRRSPATDSITTLGDRPGSAVTGHDRRYRLAGTRRRRTPSSVPGRAAGSPSTTPTTGWRGRFALARHLRRSETCGYLRIESCQHRRHRIGGIPRLRRVVRSVIQSV